MAAEDQLTVTRADPGDPAVGALLGGDWADVAVAHGTVYCPRELPGLLCRTAGGEAIGAVTFQVHDDSLEVVTFDARPRLSGAGTALLAAAVDEARRRGLRRVWLVTTNDNLDALRFYQRRGMRLVAVHPGAVDESRRVKPSIPRTGEYGIPIPDELVLQHDLDIG